VLTWALPSGFTAAQVDVCADAACHNLLWSQVVTGSSVTVGAALPTGIIHWRLTTMQGTTPGTQVSPTWELDVPGTLSAPRMTSWPSFADVNGDGYADFVAASGEQGSVTLISEQPGSSTGVSASTESSYSISGGCGWLIQGGDVNGDGYSDVLAADCSSLYVLPGSATGFSSVPASTTSWAPMANSHGAVGDFNGDGYADVALPSRGPSIAVFYGSAQAFPSTPLSFAAPTGATSVLGTWTAGDLNDDGYADMVVIDYGYDGGVGQAWVFTGSAGGLGSSPSATISAPTGSVDLGQWQNGECGPTVGGAVVSDVNGDGWLDLLLGGGTQQVIYVYDGSSSGFPAQPSATLSIPGAWNYTGGGDVNGDGYGDLIVVDNGQADIFQGSASGLPATASQTVLASNIPGATSGSADRGVALLGDVNDDGTSDFVVSVNQSWGGIEGAAVYVGSSSISQTPATVQLGSSGGNYW
jgi:hypothetical protein